MGHRCPKCNLGGMLDYEFKRHKCSNLARPTAAERDERIVAEAGLTWSEEYRSMLVPNWPLNIADGETRPILLAAARILNRIAAKRKGKRG